MQQQSDLKKPTIPANISSFLDDNNTSNLTYDDGDSLLLDSSNFTNIADIDSTSRYMLPSKDLYRLSPSKKIGSNILHVSEENYLALDKLGNQEEITSNTIYDSNNNRIKKNSPLANCEIGTANTNGFSPHKNHLLQRSGGSATEYKYSRPRTLEHSSNISQKQVSVVRTVFNHGKDELFDIKLFYQKKIAELEVVIDNQNQTITTLNIKCHKLKKGDGDKFYGNKDNFKSKVSPARCEEIDLNRSFYEDVEKLVADNERDIIKAKEILSTQNKIMKENTIKLNENLKISDEMENAASKERDVCLAKQEEYRLLVEKLRLEVLEKDNKIMYLEKDMQQLSHENQRLQKNVDDMANDATETSVAIVDLKSKIGEYKCTIETLDFSKQSEVMETEKRNKEKLFELESSLSRKIQSLQNEFTEKEANYKTLLEQHSLQIKNKQNEIQCLNDQLSKQSYESKERMSHMEQILSDLQEKYNLDITEYSERLGKQRLGYEDKLKGLLPLHAKQDMEDTIDSMRQQIVILQSEKDLLKEELCAVSKH